MRRLDSKYWLNTLCAGLAEQTSAHAVLALSANLAVAHIHLPVDRVLALAADQLIATVGFQWATLREMSPWLTSKRSLDSMARLLELTFHSTTNVRMNFLEYSAHHASIYSNSSLRIVQSNRGVSYIEYATPADAEMAIAHMNDGQVDGKVLVCVFAEPPRHRSPTPPPQQQQQRRRRMYMLWCCGCIDFILILVFK